MVNIALSGNLSLLNHLTILPALACLDDTCFPCWMRPRLAPRRPASPLASAPPSGVDAAAACRWARRSVDLALASALATLSWPVVENLLQLGGKRQMMNSSFGSFRLVNTCTQPSLPLA